MNANDGTVEGPRKPVEVALQPVRTDGDSIEENPLFSIVFISERIPVPGLFPTVVLGCEHSITRSSVERYANKVVESDES